ncbi:hypothetical protein E4T56_gene915 [Termitomyces sp. T112]|nr:hypothetical protein E4T56_gene915 [Termitomyces sp. T112]
MYSPAVFPSPLAHTSTSSLEDSEDWQDFPSELSVVAAGPSGLLLGEAPVQSAGEVVPTSYSRPGIAPRVVRPIPTGLRVMQADMMPEYFAEAMEQARGPPMLEWCQAVALCASCTWQGEQCKFEEPIMGVRRDMSVCLLYHSQHEKCSVTLSWHAACIAAEQGWDCKWVATQLEEGRRGRVSGRGFGVEGGVGAGQPPMKVGPLQGGQREGPPTMHNKGKWRASPLLEVGPSKQAQEELAMTGPLGSMVYSLTSGALVKQSAEGSWSVAKAFLQHRVEELERMPRDLPLELGQGVMQMGHLLAEHRQRATADPRAWWEVAMDVAEPLPGHPKVLAMVVAQLEVDLVGRIVEVDLEGEGE